MLPARRKPLKSGIERTPERRHPKHLQWIRGFVCCVPYCIQQVERSIAAHVRTETDGGKSLKPSDWWTISLCPPCHDRQHQLGEGPFEKECDFDMKALATEFARRSPVKEVRDMAGVRL